MTAKTLYKAKYISAEGKVGYKNIDGKMVTYFSKPMERYIVTDAKGDYKMYDPATNTVIRELGMEYSSKYSFINCFMANKTSDMGLPNLGFKLSDVRTEDKLLIKNWIGSIVSKAGAATAELVYENNLPIYIGIYNPKKEIDNKTYFGNYQKVGNINFPMSVTEITFMTPQDSSITKRTYSSPMFNEQADSKLIDFIIPSNAKVVTSPKK
ncbi:MAG: hypothetical protein J0M08_07620 [Bacteroidetes bacterium]|nr:hypothetical protein [Bacteroidota bacterium]